MKINLIAEHTLELLPENLPEKLYLLNFCIKSGMGHIVFNNGEENDMRDSKQLVINKKNRTIDETEITSLILF